MFGDLKHFRERLGCVPETTVQAMVAEIVAEYPQSARRYSLHKAH